MTNSGLMPSPYKKNTFSVKKLNLFQKNWKFNLENEIKMLDFPNPKENFDQCFKDF